MKEIVDGYSAEDLKDKIDEEGFDYFFTDYMTSDHIYDKELRERVEKYYAARVEIVKRLVELGVFKNEDDF